MLLPDRFDPRYFDRDVLFRWHAGWAGGTFSRASSAWYIDRDGALKQAASNVARIEWYDLNGDGVRDTPTTLLEPAATNLLLDSCNLPASGSAWGGSPGNFVISAAASVFSGQTAWRHTNDGSAAARNRAQTIGTFTGQPETASLIVENVNAAETAINIRDNTTSTNLCVGRLTWATGQASVQQGAGTVLARKLADMGPNGGPVYRLIATATGTAGNTRSVFIYPSGTSQNTQTAIVHHVQHEVGSIATSPIVTAASTVTRAADSLTFPWLHAPQAMTGYLRFVEAGAIVSASGFAVLQRIGAAGDRSIWIGRAAGSQSYGVTYQNVGFAVSTLPASPAPQIGDVVELVWRLYQDGSVRIEQAINLGQPAVAARSGAVGLPGAWNLTAMRLGGTPSGFNEAPAAWRDAIVLRESDWTWDDLRSIVGA